MQILEMLSGKGRLCNTQATGNKIDVHLFPIFQMHGDFLSEDDAYSVDIVLRCDNEYLVALLEDSIRAGNGDSAVAHHPGHHELVRMTGHDAAKGFTKYRRILDLAMHAAGRICRRLFIVEYLTFLIHIHLEHRLVDNQHSYYT